MEISGDLEAVRQAFEIITPGGRVSLLGTLEKPLELDIDQALIFKAAIVYGITGRRIFDTWYQMKGLLTKAAFREKISAIITHKLPMRDITLGMNLIKSKLGAKVALKPKW